MLGTLRQTCIACAFALLGCATDPTSDTTNADETVSSSASESGETENGESESGETGGEGCMDGCADDEFCDYPDGLCGAGEPGVCAPQPDACGDDPVSECGCDGMAYTQGCANEAGTDTNIDAASCMAPAGYFPCGPLLCDSSSFYCRRDVSDVGGIPDSWGCMPLPNGCGDPADCTCLEMENCGFMCEATGSGFTLTCPGG